MAGTLKKLGFKRNRAEPSLYKYHGPQGTIVCAVVVDDFAVTASSKAAMDYFKKSLHAAWSCTEGGELKWFTKLRIARDKQKKILKISQQTYLERKIAEFGLQDARKVTTPMKSGEKLSSVMSPDESTTPEE